MAGDDLEPIDMRTFPWARTGLALGTGFAILFAVVARDDDEKPVAVETPVIAPAPQVDAPPATVVPSTTNSFAPIPSVPWPPGPRRGTGKSQSQGRIVEDGDSSLTVANAESFYERAFSSCAPTRITLGKSVSLLCENAREESRVVIVPRDARRDRNGRVDIHDSGGTWLRTSRTTFSAPNDSPRLAHTNGHEDANGNASCGWTMRFVALPPGARVSSSGGSTDSGHCSFEVDGLPATTWSTMLHNLFRPGTTVHKRQLDDGEVTRWTAEGWDGGWWRVDVVSSSRNASAPANQQRARVELSMWSPGEKPWTPPFSFDEKVAALDQCWEPCALALRDSVPNIDRNDVRATLKAEEVIARCLYECRGTEQAPAVLEPAARAFTKLSTSHLTPKQREVAELAGEESIP